MANYHFYVFIPAGIYLRLIKSLVKLFLWFRNSLCSFANFIFIYDLFSNSLLAHWTLFLLLCYYVFDALTYLVNRLKVLEAEESAKQMVSGIRKTRSRSFHGVGNRRTKREVSFYDDEFLVAPPTESSEDEAYMEVEVPS